MSAPSLATAVREARTARAWSQARLASEGGVNDKTVRRLEAGHPVAHETVLALCGALGLDAASLDLPRPSAKPVPDLPADPRQRAFVASFAVPAAKPGDVVSWPAIVSLPAPAAAAPVPVPAWLRPLRRVASWHPLLTFWGAIAVVASSQSVVPAWAVDALFGLVILTSVAFTVIATPAAGADMRDIKAIVRRERDERDRATAYIPGRESVSVLLPGKDGIRRLDMPAATFASVVTDTDCDTVTATIQGVLGTLVLDRMPSTEAVVRRLADWSAVAGMRRAEAGRDAA